MTPVERAILADRTSSLHRHLDRVREKLPATPGGLVESRDAADAVILHLWQATQIVIDLAVAACAAAHLGTPQSYADAFRKLAATAVIEAELADRLVRAAGFRNVVAHAYDTLDLKRVYDAATRGPADLLAFIAALERWR
jgi:uncharacterized protein YutE (UPF0331/DUF86 family)